VKNFIRKSAWLEQAPLEIRWIYGLFLIFALVGHASFILIAMERVGSSVTDILQHYRGAEEEMAFPKEFVELLEVTHFHAYIEGVVLLVLTHLFIAVPLSRAVKMTVILTAFGSTFLDLAAPWAIRYLPAPAAFAAALGQMIAWVGMGISNLFLTLVPLYFLYQAGDRADSDR
jgi:hypothetical protein